MHKSLFRILSESIGYEYSMNQKPCPSNSAISDQIRQEIQRFESVHPCIYAIYDFVDLIPDQLIAQQIRDHVVCIEDSFVNSQEWTLSRSVPDLKLGVLGSIASGKSALVHRYLTGSYMQEESPEGGRFKKEVVIDGQSYLLLIRDEGGLPEEQFTQWVDAVILVFSLESEVSFNAAYNYYAKMARFRNTAEIPIILVGSQDAICTNRPRVVEEARARRLANDLKRCPYYETCATYGLNVERVFREACQKIIVQRQQGTVMSLPPCNSCQRTPSHMSAKTSFNFPSQQFSQSGGPPSSSALPLQLSPLRRNVSTTGASNLSPSHCAAMQCSTPSTSSMKDYCATMSSQGSNNSVSSLGVNLARPSASHNLNNNSEKENHASDVDAQECGGIPTPSSTPTANRKTNRRISNIFKKDDDNKRNHSSAELGSGRAIPIKQGNLYKRSNKPLNKEWKKKFVALYDDGRLTYHSNIKDYMEENNGKELFLGHTTVKVPGQYRPRNSRCQTQPILSNGILTKDFTTSKLSFRKPGSSSDNQSVHLTAFETIPETKAQKFSNIHDFGVNGDEFSMSANLETPNLKKKKHFKKTSGKSDTQDADSCEFIIVSIDNRQWHFEAASQEERDEWVQAIEQQILCSLQGNETNKSKDGNIAQSDETAVLALREVEGNSACADCGMPGPDWVSINLGALICIECSGIHRNLGSHISKVRSLDLDSWPVPYISVLRQLGNNVVNRIWEYKVGTAHRIKPESTSSREVKEKWIRAKYERNEFLAPLPNGASVSQQLLDAILHKELTAVLLALAHGGPALLKHTVSSKDLRLPLHFACAVACPRIVQLLLWWNANPDVADHEGHTALYYARQSGSTDCIEILQYAGCTTSTVEPPRLRTNELSRDNSTTNSRLQQPLRHSSDVFDNLPDSVI